MSIRKRDKKNATSPRKRKPREQREDVSDKDKRKNLLFEELFNTYRNRVYYITRRYTKNEEDALDLVQEIFVKAYRALDSLDSGNNYGAWIYRIAVNHCIDRVRKKRRPEFSYDEFVENGGAIAEPSFTPHQNLSCEELRTRVLKLVEKLSPEHRAVLLLHCMENLAYRQIARVLGCSIGTVMSRLHYARKYLKQTMQVHAMIG
jgi:RNA polymerase sigma-70 factor (ECF subfamily)